MVHEIVVTMRNSIVSVLTHKKYIVHSSFVLQDAQSQSAKKNLVKMLLALDRWKLNVWLIWITAVRHGLLIVKMSLTYAKVSFNTSRE